MEERVLQLRLAIRSQQWEAYQGQLRVPGWTRERLQGFLHGVLVYGGDVSMLEALETAAVTEEGLGLDWAGYRTSSRKTLLFSAWYTPLETIEWLLNRGVDPWAVDAQGRTAEAWWWMHVLLPDLDERMGAKFEALRRRPCGLK